MNLIDLNTLRRKGRFTILSQSQELQLKDGSLTRLHLVLEGSTTEPSRFLRAIASDIAGTFIFDVRDLAKSLDLDIRQLPKRDSLGVVTLTLRQRYATLADLFFKIIEEAQVSFRDTADTPGAEALAEAA